MLRRLVFSIATISLAACQQGSEPPKVSLQEARQIASGIEVTDFKPPPRTIDDIKQAIGTLPPVPNDCAEEIDFRELEIENLVARIKRTKSQDARANLAAALSFRASAEFARGNLKQATGLVEQALDILPESGIRFRRMSLHALLSNIYAASGNISTAQDHLGRATAEWDAIGQGDPNFAQDSSNRLVFEQYDNLGRSAIAQARGQMRQAEHHYRKTLDIAEYDSTRVAFRYVDIHRLRSDFSFNLLNQGRLAEAELVARAAVKKVTGHVSNIGRYTAVSAQPFAQLASVLLEQGRIADAEYIARTAVQIHNIDCSVPGSLAYTNARKVLARVLAEKQDWRGVIEQIEAVRRGLAKDPATFERQFGGNAEWGLALIHTGQARQGFERFNTSLKRTLAEEGPDSLSAAEARALLAVARAATGDQAGALKDFTTALPVMVKTRNRDAVAAGQSSRTFRQTRILEAYLKLLDRIRGTPLESQQGIDAIAEMFRVAAMIQAGEVQGALNAASARNAAKDPALADLVRREQDAAHEMAVVTDMLANMAAASEKEIEYAARDRLRGRVGKLRQARAAIQQEIASRFPDFAETMNPKPMTIAEARAALKTGEAVMLFYVTDKTTFVWAVPHQGRPAFAAVKLGRRALQDTVVKLRTALTPTIATLGDIPDFDLKAAHALYRQLLQPVESGWKSARTLLVIPHGGLGFLPLPLLPTKPHVLAAASKTLFSNYRAVPWLARTHAVTMLPAVGALRSLRQTAATTKGTKRFIGFGDPFFSKRQARTARRELQQVANLRSRPVTRGANSADISILPRLPDTRDELQAVAATLKVDPKTSLFLGAEANEQRVKSMDLSNVAVLSFATHGLVPGDLDGLTQPALALSAPDVSNIKGDGLLTMGEIMGLRLNADWVILSACNTGAAGGAGAEAVSGLGRAFLYAGSRALLVSNWPVHSAATRALMTDLFRRTTSGTRQRAEALRQAMVSMIDDQSFKTAKGKIAFSYAHPIFWAPFSLIGDSGG